MQFSEASSYLERLEKTASRNQITEILSDLYKKCSKEEIDKITYLVLGQLAPNYKGIVLNIAEKMMFRVFSKAYKMEIGEVRKLFKVKGDLGEVALSLAKSKKDLSVVEVYERLMAISEAGGAGSQERKVVLMAELLSSLNPLSAKYVSRIPVGRLRLGFSDMTILDSLSFMLTKDKSKRKEIENAFNVSCDIGRIASLIKAKGMNGIKDITPQAGIPIRPSLCERLPSAEKILEKVGKTVYVEPKYDGFRSQIHIYEEEGKKKVAIFSRNLESTTAMFPDLVEVIEKIKVKSAIFDGEAIGYDPKNDKFLPFQETIQRKRKHGIEKAAVDFPLRLFLFDVLFLNGKSLLEVPFSERRSFLEKVDLGGTKTIEIARQVKTDNADTIRDLIKKYLSEGLEGAVIKKIDAPYKAGGRGYHWVKYKKTTVKGVADTIDCLVLGVNKGKGKRTGFGVGAFLVGIKDKDTFKSVSKIGTGLSDEQWRELDRRTRALEVKVKPTSYEVDKNLTPDVWVKPSLVVEILADEITRSPIHKAGLALRFPRLIKFRDEKGPSEVTTLEELQKLYQMQKV
jgi:DNA ligase 1